MRYFTLNLKLFSNTLTRLSLNIVCASNLPHTFSKLNIWIIFLILILVTFNFQIRVLKLVLLDSYFSNYSLRLKFDPKRLSNLAQGVFQKDKVLFNQYITGAWLLVIKIVYTSCFTSCQTM